MSSFHTTHITTYNGAMSIPLRLHTEMIQRADGRYVLLYTFEPHAAETSERAAAASTINKTQDDAHTIHTPTPQEKPTAL